MFILFLRFLLASCIALASLLYLEPSSPRIDASSASNPDFQASIRSGLVFGPAILPVFTCAGSRTRSGMNGGMPSRSFLITSRGCSPGVFTSSDLFATMASMMLLTPASKTPLIFSLVALGPATIIRTSLPSTSTPAYARTLSPETVSFLSVAAPGVSASVMLPSSPRIGRSILSLSEETTSTYSLSPSPSATPSTS